MLDKNEFIEELKSKVQKVPESKYSVPIYIATVFIVLIWTYFINSKGYLCLSAILQATVALLVPLKFYKEKSVKKIAVVGILSLLILFSVFSAYNVHQRYDLSIQELESDNLKNGTVNNLYGEGGDEFNFSVSVHYEENYSDQNFSVYVNLTYTQFNPESSDFHEDNYELNKIENGTEYYREITLEEKLYQHHFVLEDNTTDDGNTTWEETEKGRGPNTVPQTSTFLAVFILQMPYPLFVFLLLIGVVWWRRRMNKSKESSTEGLEEKEEDLEDYCEECGSLLDGEEVCPECGNNVVFEDDEKKDDKKDKENRIKCENCGRMVFVEKGDCPYCGYEL